MRVTKWKDEGLILEGDIAMGIEEAFNERRYVEAFALLHGWLDWLMHSVFQNHEVSKGRADLRTLIDENPPWKTSLDRLSKNEIISDKVRQRLVAFNSLRNRVIHRLIVRGYQPSRVEKLTQTEVDEGFNEGKALVQLLKEKSGTVFLSQRDQDKSK